MSKVGRPSVEVYCADCSATDPLWASVNRGVLLCNDCASIHQSLGRHVSQVKHTKKSFWHPCQSQMVHQLAQIGANSIWEHSLLDPSQGKGGKRKPSPTDPMHPIKQDFIRSKYENLQFVNRCPRREDDDLGKQLHSSVRTANLDTSLRLLSIGAHANYFHPEKGNTPLHVAAKSGQNLQIELLVSYGADPALPDNNKQTPEDVARTEGHTDLADRLVELQYELPDRLTFFAGKIRPDHKTRSHYIVPKLHGNSIAKDGKIKLQALSNEIFEELAVDVYDEIDRRETEMIWQNLKQQTNNGTNKKNSIDHTTNPFLTLNPDYSPTRNQGRQKLARFSNHEFTILIHDILCDIIRRQCGRIINGIQQEDPIYDVPPDGQPDSDVSAAEVRKHHEEVEEEMTAISVSELCSLQDDLNNKELQIFKLQEDNRNLTTKVTMFLKEIKELKRTLKSSNGSSHHHHTTPTHPSPSPYHSPFTSAPSTQIHRRRSVHNPGIGQNKSSESIEHQRPQTIIGAPSETNHNINKDDGSGDTQSNNGNNNNFRTPSPLLDPFASNENDHEQMPPYMEIEDKSRAVTKNISTLLALAQKAQTDAYRSHTENIYTSVMDIINLFPSKSISEELLEVIKKFYTATCKLKKKSEDVTNPKTLTEELIKLAYEIAKAEKDLVTWMKMRV